MDSPQTGLRTHVPHSYQDPVDLVWLHCAARAGIIVRRNRTVFAAWDGGGTLTLGESDTLDPDDSIAQMILHELCHHLVEGPDSWFRPDWGLQIDDPTQRYREHACLRLQAALADTVGLRHFFGATTSFRVYYDALGSDPLESGDDPAIEPAQWGWERAQQAPWLAPLKEALESTCLIARVVEPIAPTDSIWSCGANR